MAKPKIKDLVVVLPGITGSVLEKDGRDLWALSGSAIWNTLVTMGGWLDNLALDEPEADDGVVATGLIDTIHLIPGLVKIDGYTGLTRMIQEKFEVVSGSIDSDAPANFFEYPYDWRRDNRRIARELEGFLSRRLSVWREYTNNPDARVILLAHSMGGLVSRYFCEVLGGWEMCRALVTFGTPHRGSPNAVSFLANGFKKLFVDLTGPLHTFPSVYQLLPIYPVVATGSGTVRVAETEIPGIDPGMAADGLAFHREIEAAVASNSREEAYRRDFATLPFVGARQPTLQSATLSGGKLTASRDLPEGFDPLLGDGDGTVPRLSAIPIELSTEYRDTFVPERHSGLHNHGGVLQDLYDRIVLMQTSGLADIRGPGDGPVSPDRPALSVDLDDLYLDDEDLVIEASMVNGEADAVSAIVTSTDGGESGSHEFEAAGDVYRLDLTGLQSGGYRIEVRARVSDVAPPPPVHDVFVVAG